MVNIPLPTSYKGIDDLPKQRENLINLFPVDSGVTRTPGIDSVAVAGTEGCRAATTWFLDGKPYYVIGESLYRLESDFTLTSLGVIPGMEYCVFSGGQVELVIIVKDGPGYTYSEVNGLQQITNPNFRPCISVTFIDGSHVYIPADGSPAFWSEVDQAGNILSSSFFDAEELPDINKHTINLKNILAIFGQESIEFFRSTGNADLRFSRQNGTRINNGYVSGGSRYRTSYVFIGRDSGQSYAIFAMTGQGQPQQISNAVVTEDLNELGQADIESARVNRFKWLDKEFIAWTIANKTYAFVDGSWIFMDSELNGTENGIWRANGIAFAYGRYYVGDVSTGDIGKLSDSPKEYSNDVEYQIDTFLRSSRGSDIRPRGLEVDVLTGQESSTLGLALSKDGRIRGDYFYRDLGSTGEYRRRVRWMPPGGLGDYENYMGISIRGTGKVNFSMESLNVIG